LDEIPENVKVPDPINVLSVKLSGPIPLRKIVPLAKYGRVALYRVNSLSSLILMVPIPELGSPIRAFLGYIGE
jgi:hypothetical protein